MSEGKQSSKSKTELKYSLPNSSISFDKEIEIVKGLYEFSNKGSNPVTYKNINIGIKDKSKISTELTFLESINMAQKVERGKYLPTKECERFVTKYRWNQNEGKNILCNILGNTWFVELTEKMIRTTNDNRIKEDKLIENLGMECNADPITHKKSIERLIDWMKYANILQEKEGKLELIKEITEENIEHSTEENIIQTPINHKIHYGIPIQILIQITPETTKEQIREIMQVIKDIWTDEEQ